MQVRSVMTLAAILIGHPAFTQQVKTEFSAEKKSDALPTAGIALIGATIYDGNGGPPLRDAVVVIEGERIACVGTRQACPIPAGARTTDLSGRFLTPGLVDAHVHFSHSGWFDAFPETKIGLDRYDYAAVQRRHRDHPERWHRAWLCSGITAVYNTGGYPWVLAYESQTEHDPERVHVRAAGPLIQTLAMNERKAMGVSNFLPMNTDEEAIASVRKLVAWKSRAVKVRFLPVPKEQEAAYAHRMILIGAEARANGLPLLVHVYELRNAKVALEAGAHMLVHSVLDQPVDDEFLRLAKRAGTIYVPTLTVGQNARRARASIAFGIVPEVDDPHGCVDGATRRLLEDAPALQAKLPPEERGWLRNFNRIEAGAERMAIAKENLRRVHSAGIPIATGTDSANVLTFHGPSIYAEMEAMQDVGISAGDVIVMSTRNGALAMGRLHDFGTLERGKIADVVILTKDPGQNVSAFRSITTLMRAGVLNPIRHFASSSRD